MYNCYAKMENYSIAEEDYDELFMPYLLEGDCVAKNKEKYRAEEECKKVCGRIFLTGNTY